MKYIIDSCIWIDYLRGKYKGLDDIQSIIELEDIYLPTLIIAEIRKAYSGITIEDFNEDLNQMKSYGNISLLENLKEIIAIRAGELIGKLAPLVKARKTIGLVDCILLSIAIEIDAKILSGDDHFRIISQASELDFPKDLQYLENFVIYNGGRR